MNLIDNLRVVFSDTFHNLDEVGRELQDINDSLSVAISQHIESPLGNKSFVPVGFGQTWKQSYSLEGLPTDVLISNADWIDSLIKPILSDAVAAKLNNVSLLMNTANPVTAQAAVSVVLSVLGRATGLATSGASAIASALNTANTTATSTPGGLAALPSAVSTAIGGLAGLVTADRLSSVPYAEQVNTLDNDLQLIGLVGARNSRQIGWNFVKSQILTIPKNSILQGERGADFWRAILLTINQAIPRP